MGSCVGCGTRIPFLKMLCATCKHENDLLAESKSPKRPIKEDE